MSSPKAAAPSLPKAAKMRRGKIKRSAKRDKARARGGTTASEQVMRKTKPAASGSASAQALKLAAEMERGIAGGRLDVISHAALQRLTAAVCKTYSQQVQSGAQALPLQQQSGVSPTDVMIVASGLLRATDLQVFELGMWQSWTGR